MPRLYKLSHHPFLILSTSLVIGILLGHHLTWSFSSLIIAQGVCIAGLIISWKYARKIFRRSYGFTLFVILTFIAFGVIRTQMQLPKNIPNHYSHFSFSKNTDTIHRIHFYIKEQLKPTPHYHKYAINILSLDNHTATGTLLLNIPKNTNALHTLEVGNQYLSTQTPIPVPTAHNPQQFDYASYLQKQHMYHQITINNDALIDTDTPITTIYSIAHSIRASIQQALQHYSFTDQQLALINALILGQRQQIDATTVTDYQKAGAAHLLAISGLHMGLFVLFIHYLLAPLRHFRKGAVLQTLVSILCLWCFAIVAGLSPSILRAATMFSFIAIGMHLNTMKNTYNSIYIALFLLLCYDPMLLFQIGFQLSFLAVFSILHIHPLLTKYYSPRYYIDTVLWNTLTVSIAAQLGLAPLTLFYFHQFPLLFLVSNLLIIPLLGCIIGGGIIIVLLAILRQLPNWMVDSYGSIIDTLNNSIHWIAAQDAFVLTDIPFSWRMLLASYLLGCMLLWIIQKYTPQKIYGVLIALLMIASIYSYETYTHHHQKEFIIFHQYRATAIGVLEGKQFEVYHNSLCNTQTAHYTFTNYAAYHKATHTEIHSLQNVYQYQQQKVLIVDSTGIYNVQGFTPDIVLLSASPKIHLDRLLCDIRPKYIVADGSNYTSYINLWEASCKQKNIPFYRTDRQGAFILPID